jgi:hypothetical protein
MTLSLASLLEQPSVIHLLERAYVSQMLVMKEHGGDQDLRGSSHRSVTPNIHRRFYVILLSRI